MNAKRHYRHIAGNKRFKTFTVVVKETNLWIAVPPGNFTETLPAKSEHVVRHFRRQLESYIKINPEFAATREPYMMKDTATAPEIALEMIRAGNAAGVGPMAAVAGALAENVGQWLLRDCSQVIVENGGDIFMKNVAPAKIAIFAGESPLSEKVALLVEPENQPCGICTSSGTVGHAYSRGRADAAVVISPSAALADAVATATGNLVQGPADLEQALDFARNIDGISGAVIICGERIALWGKIQLQPLG